MTYGRKPDTEYRVSTAHDIRTADLAAAQPNNNLSLRLWLKRCNGRV